MEKGDHIWVDSQHVLGIESRLPTDEKDRLWANVNKPNWFDLGEVWQDKRVRIQLPNAYDDPTFAGAESH